MPNFQSVRLSGALVLRNDALIEGDVVICDGWVTDAQADRSIDLRGYLVLPGIIDLHGDAFERHLAPRPSAPFPSEVGLQAVDHDAAANGVTTAWMAQSWSWEGGSRGPEFAESFMEALAQYRPRALTDLRIQIRCETHTVETEARLLAAIARHGIDYVIFNDHIAEALDMVENDPEGLAVWAKRAGRDVAAHIAIVKAAQIQRARVPRYLCNLANAFDRAKIRYGSHDDPDAATRDYYGMIGARICEFPIRVEPAQVAHAMGNPVLMGAPNVVRRGSQSGNIAATDLIRRGLCDALVSDYHYPSLARAAFSLADDGMMSFGAAWQMISTNPARIMRLTDRGTLVAGNRADIVICNAQTRQIEGTMVAGRWSHICGGLAERLTAPQPAIAHAAE